MRYLAIIDLNDDDLAEARGMETTDEISDSLAARLGEVYDNDANVVRTRLVGAADVTTTLEFFLAAAEVGIDGAEEDILEPYGLTEADAEEAWVAVIRLQQLMVAGRTS